MGQSHCLVSVICGGDVLNLLDGQYLLSGEREDDSAVARSARSGVIVYAFNLTLVYEYVVFASSGVLLEWFNRSSDSLALDCTLALDHRSGTESNASAPAIHDRGDGYYRRNCGYNFIFATQRLGIILICDVFPLYYSGNCPKRFARAVIPEDVDGVFVGSGVFMPGVIYSYSVEVIEWMEKW